MNPKNLSKVKHIYKLYQASDGRVHVEKFHVIYANKDMVYYKVGNILKHQHNRNIFDSIDSTNVRISEHTLSIGLYLWTEPDLTCDLVKRFRKRVLEKELRDSRHILELYRRRVAEYESKIDQIKKELEEINETE